jgi:DNA-binding NtrC family response regulator
MSPSKQPLAPAPRILIIDQDEQTRKNSALILDSYGLKLDGMADGAMALAKCRECAYDLVLADLDMAGQDAIETIRAIKQQDDDVEIIVMTGHASVFRAMDAIRAGAYDYLQKPFSPDEFMLVVNNALQKRRLVRENRSLREKIQRRYGMENIIGNSETMRSIYSLARKASGNTDPVFLVGEVGAGKEMIARAIHYNGARSMNQFVVADCSSLAPSLVDSELFGQIKSAATATASSKAGLVECAHQGTLFIDELAVIPMETQQKIVEFMDAGRFTPKGAESPMAADVRLIIGTRHSRDGLAAEGKIHPGLLDAMDRILIPVPPLRERKEDIPLLATHFLSLFAEEFEKDISGFTHEAIHNLMEYDWPGNVRALKNAIEQAVILASEDKIYPEDLPQHFTEHNQERDAGFTVPLTNEDLKKAKNRLNRRIERQFVIEALRRNNWNVTRAASETGLARPNFHALMRRYDITAPKGSD